MLVLTDWVDDYMGIPDDTLKLTAAERRQVRHLYTSESGQTVKLDLPRSTLLKPGSHLTTPDRTYWIQVLPQAEPLYDVTARDPLDLLRAAYHLGNRHVPLEISTQGLKLERDPVLKHLLVEHLGLKVEEQISAFLPDPGAYHHHH